jgi:small subunit ribosomal protein S9
LNDLDQVSITAVKLEGAIHEFYRLPGVREPTLSVLFQFRKIVLHAPFLERGKIIVISFLFSGPGMFFAKDISFPLGIQCRNLGISLVTLASGALLRGHLLIQKKRALGSIFKSDRTIRLGETWSYRIEENSNKTYESIPLVRNFQKATFSPWLSLGFPGRTIERVGFRIEMIGPLNQYSEILIFEILTNGIISPRQALRESSLFLVNKFLDVAQRTLPSSQKIQYLKRKAYTRKKRHYCRRQERKTEIAFVSNEAFYNLCNLGFSRFREPMCLEVRNLELRKESYRELRHLGIQTFGQLLERLSFEPTIFSPILKKQRQLALFRLGLFPFSCIYMENLTFFTKTVGRRKAAIANIKLLPGCGRIRINGSIGKDMYIYPDRLLVVTKPCAFLPHIHFDIKSKSKGGGLRRQIESLQLALARGLVFAYRKNRRIFRKKHFLTRDSREKERRKYGLKKARKSPQFSKR